MWVNETTYMRVMLPDLLPDHYQRALYLDSDVIVEADLMRLWMHGVRDHVLLAVRDYFTPTVASPNSGLVSTYRSLGMEPSVPYFNAGIILLNLTTMRARRIAAATFAYLRAHHDSIKWWDQDGLNAVVAGEWGQLDLRWNVQVWALRHFERSPDSQFKREQRERIRHVGSDPYILHFTFRKPWRPGDITDLRYRPRFFRYLRRSGWFSRWEYARWFTGWLVSALAHSLSVLVGRMRDRLRPLVKPGN